MSGRSKIEDYLSLHYPVLVTRDSETSAFVVEVPDWPGCMTHGVTIDEAFDKLEDAKYTWVDDCLERGLPIPEPREDADYSGKFLLRLPRSLHRRLAQLAEENTTSLNRYVSNVLAEHVGVYQGTRGVTEIQNEFRAWLDDFYVVTHRMANTCVHLGAAYGWQMFLRERQTPYEANTLSVDDEVQLLVKRQRVALRDNV